MTAQPAQTEKLNRYLAASTAFHIALFAFVIFSQALFPFGASENWGSSTAASGGINATLADSVSGIPLPSPPAVREDVAANESPGLNKSEPVPPPPPTPDAEPVPATKAPVKTTPAPKPAPASTAAKTKTKEPVEPPSNDVPYGQGGKPAMAYGQFPTGAGEAGIDFGDGAFGSRYEAYVNAITRRISQNWLKSLVDSRVQSAPRVYLSFQIERDGTVTNVAIKQGSGIPTLDRSAMRAILASNPLLPLPADYRGASVTVSFYFEYSRQ